MPKSSRRPNILFFFSDQRRWDTCGCYGQPLSITPNLDAMAAEGTRFVHAFTCQPVCGPARAALQTGRYPSETGCFINNKALPEDESTLARRFGAAGYETAQEPRHASESIFWLGYCKEKTGNPGEAARCYRRVMEKYPQSEAAKLAQDRLDGLASTQP